jgi:rod shape-determining protein MreC
MMLLACVALAIIGLIMPARYREAAASALRASVLAPLVQLESQSSGVHAAITSRRDVLTARARAATDSLSIRAIVDENTTLRRMMGLSARLQDGFVVAELLPRRGVDDDFTLSLNVGSTAGVERFAPVVTADGIVGMIERVDKNTSFAITWADPSFRVSAMSVDEVAFGIVQPHLGTGVERLMLELRGVPFRAKLDSGALIVSSGLGATFPRGIPVGTVVGDLTRRSGADNACSCPPCFRHRSTGDRVARRTRGVASIRFDERGVRRQCARIAAAGDRRRKTALDEVAARRALWTRTDRQSRA